MKLLVFLLVLANLLFFAFVEGYFGRADNPDAGRIEKQVLAERMRIVSTGEVPAAPAKLPEPVKSEPAVEEIKAEIKMEAKPETPSEVVSKAVDVTPVCLAWERLSLADADRLSSLLASRFAEFKVARQTVGGEGNGWWVFITPLPGKAEADKKAAELRLFGVTDYFIVPDGPNRFAISLGVFSTEKGGQDRLAEVKEKGVRSARLMPRLGKDSGVSMQARGPARAKLALLESVRQALPKSAGQGCK